MAWRDGYKMKNINLKPRISEKAYGLSQTSNTYVFDVPLSTNKQTISEIVTEQFEVGVMSVRTTNIKGKSKTTYLNKRGKHVKGSRSDFKKAYVTLIKGASLPIFAAEEEAEDKAKKAEKKTKTKRFGRAKKDTE